MPMVNAASPIEFRTPTRTVAGAGGLAWAGAAAAAGAAVAAGAAALDWLAGAAGAAERAAGAEQARSSASRPPEPPSAARDKRLVEPTTAHSLPPGPAAGRPASASAPVELGDEAAVHDLLHPVVVDDPRRVHAAHGWIVAGEEVQDVARALDRGVGLLGDQRQDDLVVGIGQAALVGDVDEVGDRRDRLGAVGADEVDRPDRAPQEAVHRRGVLPRPVGRDLDRLVLEGEVLLRR